MYLDNMSNLRKITITLHVCILARYVKIASKMQKITRYCAFVATIKSNININNNIIVNIIVLFICLMSHDVINKYEKIEMINASSTWKTITMFLFNICYKIFKKINLSASKVKLRCECCKLLLWKRWFQWYIDDIFFKLLITLLTCNTMQHC